MSAPTLLVVLGVVAALSGQSAGPAETLDNTMRIWDPAMGAGLLTVPADATMYGAVRTPDGTRLALPPLNRTIVRLDSVPVAERAARR